LGLLALAEAVYAIRPSPERLARAGRLVLASFGFIAALGLVSVVVMLGDAVFGTALAGGAVAEGLGWA
jgi:hypothetical protein